MEATKVAQPTNGQALPEWASRLTAEWQLVTPERARVWIDNHNHRNRRIRRARVEFYGQQQTEGNWLPGPDAVAFDWDGALINGQHRLLAIIKTGIPQVMLVAEGLHPDAIYVIDDGSKRMAADGLDIHGGLSNTRNLAAIARLIINWQAGQLQSFGAKVSNKDIARAVEMHSPLVQHSAAYANQCGPLVTPRLFGFLHFAYTFNGFEEIEDFLGNLSAGVGRDVDGDPVSTLVSRLVRLRTGRQRPDDTYVLALCIRAANAFCERRPLHVLRWSATENFPYPVTP